MNRKSAKKALAFILTLLVALLLQTVALPYPVAIIWPNWTLLVLSGWALNTPRAPSMLAGLVLGLAMDVQLNCILGEHALGLVLVTYTVSKMRGMLALYERWRVALILAPLWAGYLLLLSMIDHATGHVANPGLRWWPLPMTIIMWPAVDVLIARLSPKPAGGSA